ncbi:ADP-ribosylglycohydrolase family protein [bacterium]|nr:MAG: ADP-ribosylglycohydrolase family protein [bacterium]
MDSSPSARLNRALGSLEGLSIGDAFGEQFFMSFEMVARLLNNPEKWWATPYDFEDDFVLRELIKPRRLEFCAPSWRWTDDTAMALEIVAELRDNEQIDPDSLARRFTRRFLHDENRGYGPAMHSLLPRLEREGWQDAAQNLFAGKGSYGNGSAMRVPPLGAYFADDFAVLIEQARLSAIVTHSHDEAIAGAIAAAVAAGIVARSKNDGVVIILADFLDEIIFYTPDSEVKDG